MIKNKAVSWFKILLRTKKVIKVEKISGKGNILTVKVKQTPLIGNKTNRSFEIAPWQRELEAKFLKADNIQIKKLIEKEITLFSGIG